MRYLPDHKITFIHNPKTAGTSISNWLDQNFKTIKGRKHGNHNEVWEFFPKTGFTFGVVRNPWERMASWYYMLREPCSFEDFLYTRINNKISVGLTFQPRVLWARNWYNLGTTQYEWFGESTNFILKFESLENDFKIIQEKLNCYSPLPKLNKSIDFDYRTMYTDDTAEYIHDVFLKDIINYDYNF